MTMLLVPASASVVIVFAVDDCTELVALGAVPNVVVTKTTLVDTNDLGESVMADATSTASDVAAPGPLPTAGTMPTCFEVTVTASSPSPAEDGAELVGDGNDDEGAGRSADTRVGGFVLADAISPAGNVAASGPLPTAGTLPICFDVMTGEPSFSRSTADVCTEAVTVLRFSDSVGVNGAGGTVFADTRSSSSMFAAPGPLPAAGTEPICFSGSPESCGCLAAASTAD